VSASTFVRLSGLLASIAYAAGIVWVYASQPRTVAELKGGVAATVGAYRVDPQHFGDGLRYFRADQFPEARAALQRADPAQRDAVTQFYVAYTFYRQGWGRFYNDDALFTQGLQAVDRAIALAPAGRLVIDDPTLGMRSADELRAELQRGLARDVDDLNPMKVFRPRR
jgi:hypothetical protein